MTDLMTLDRVTRLEPGVGADAIRNVPHTWPIFDTHFPRRPVVPGVVITGCLERLAGLLLAEQTGHDDWAIAGARRVRFRSFVQPGDQMELSVEIDQATADEVTLKARASVDGKAVTTFGSLRMRRRSAP